MNIEQVKQELLSKLEQKGCDLSVQPFDNFRESQTASELASCMVEKFKELYKVMGADLCDFVMHTFDPKVWEAQGLLINPEEISGDKSIDSKLVVVADGSVKTVQNTEREVDYYGNVDLVIKSGMANVWDTRFPVLNENCDILTLMGHTQAISHGYSILDLKDHASAEVSNAFMIEVRDHAYVESKAGNPQITAKDHAQYLVSGGSAEVTQEQEARGVILNKNNPDETYKITAQGTGVLLIEDETKPNMDAAELMSGGFILKACGDLDKSTLDHLIDMVVPKHKGADNEDLSELTRYIDFIHDSFAKENGSYTYSFNDSVARFYAAQEQKAEQKATLGPKR